MGEQTIPAGYKQTEIGVIPEDWEFARLGDIGQTIIGLTYSPKDVSNHGTLVLRSSNVQNGKLAYEDNVYVNMELPERVIVKEGDILVCVRNGSRQLIGKCALIDMDADGSAFGAFMSVFRALNSKFIFYQFQSNLIQNQINEIMGATINQITNKDMSSFIIALPKSKQEQTAIANALSDVDALISEQEKLIAKKQAIKTATMQQLLTGKTRLPPFAHHPDGTPKRTKQTELGEIPEDWGVFKFLDVMIRINTKSNQVEASQYLDFGLYPVVDQGKDFVAAYSDKRNRLFNNDNDGVVIFGDHTCIVKFVDFDFLVGADGVQVIKSKKGFSTRYMSFVMQYYQVESTGYNRHFGVLKEKFYPIPSDTEQTAIAQILSDMDEEIQTLEQRLAKTRQLKQGMMQQLLTGKVRLI